MRKLRIHGMLPNLKHQANRFLFAGFLSGIILGIILRQFLFPRKHNVLTMNITSQNMKTIENLEVFNKSLFDYYKTTEGEDSNDIKHPNSKTTDRVLCWMPVLRNNDIQLIRILMTYGKYCDKFYFISKNENPDIVHVIGHHYERLTGKDLWNQVHRGWNLVSDLHLSEIEWFVKLDQDSFFIPQNFIHLVHEKKWDSENLAYFGHTIYEQSRRVTDARALMNVGAGYGISRRMLRELTPYFPNNSHSNIPKQRRCTDLIRWGEDMKFADCVHTVFPTFIPNSTKDKWNRENFVPYEPNAHMKMSWGDSAPWFWRGKDPTTTNTGIHTLSSRPVLFHHFKRPHWFYFVEHFLFKVNVDPIRQGSSQN